MPCLVLGSQNMLAKCSWWADCVFQGWCWFCIKVTDPSVLDPVWAAVHFVKDLTKPKDTFSPPSACSLYSLHSWEFFSRGQMDYTEGRKWPLAYFSTSKSTPYMYTQGKYLFTIFHIYCSCSLYSVPYGLSFGATCAYSSTNGAAQAVELISFMWKSLNETKWTDLAITQNFIKRVYSFLYWQWNQPLNHAVLLCTKPGLQSWFPRMPEKEKQVKQGHN